MSRQLLGNESWIRCRRHFQTVRKHFISSYIYLLLQHDHIENCFWARMEHRAWIYSNIYNGFVTKNFFSRESDSTIANVCLSVSPSEIKTPQPLRIKPICHYAYLLISQIPISHHANQLSCQTATMPPPHSAIMPISDYSYSYQPPSCLLANISIDLPCFRDF